MRIMSTFLLLLIFVGFSAALQDPSQPLVDSSSNSNMLVWVIGGVVATTTISVLIILIPTILYYKSKGKIKCENGVDKI